MTAKTTEDRTEEAPEPRPTTKVKVRANVHTLGLAAFEEKTIPLTWEVERSIEAGLLTRLHA